MSSFLDSVHTENAALGSYYQKALVATITTLWRRKLFVVAAMLTALTLGIIAALVTPKQYTAEAFIRGGFTVAGQKGATDVLVPGLEPGQVVETRSRIVQSHQLARQVLDRLGIERLRPVVGGSGLSAWLQEIFYGDPTTRNPEYQLDLAAIRLLRGLSVKTEPRVYQITVQYTAGGPELAALIANTFVAEYLRVTALQMLSDWRASAQAALTEQLAHYGDKHPKVWEARLRLQTADALLDEQLSKPSEEIRRAAGENIMSAQAVAVPSSPDPKVFIGLSLLAGFVLGVGLALFVDRGKQGVGNFHLQ